MIIAADAIGLALGLLRGVVASTPNKVDDLVVNGLSEAIGALEKVHGTPVTKAQLESFRITPQW